MLNMANPHTQLELCVQTRVKNQVTKSTVAQRHFTIHGGMKEKAKTFHSIVGIKVVKPEWLSDDDDNGDKRSES